jgi:hypothetical protein
MDAREDLWNRMVAEAAEASVLTPKVREEFERKFEPIRRELGNSFAEILAREPEVGRDRIHNAIHTAISWKYWIQQPLEQIESAYLGVYALHAEVNNGGFDQFFFNSAGDYWRDILWLMRESKDEDGVRRFLDVLSIFPRSEPSVDRGERWKQMDKLRKWPWQKWKLDRHFNRHDKEYYARSFPDRERFWQVVKERLPAVSITWA